MKQLVVEWEENGEEGRVIYPEGHNDAADRFVSELRQRNVTAKVTERDAPDDDAEPDAEPDVDRGARGAVRSPLALDRGEELQEPAVTEPGVTGPAELTGPPAITPSSSGDADAEITDRVVEIGGKFYVVTSDGAERSGPYDTHDEAAAAIVAPPAEGSTS